MKTIAILAPMQEELDALARRKPADLLRMREERFLAIGD